MIELLRSIEDLSGVVFEITEQSPVEDYEMLVSVLSELRGRGAMIAVDDAGAGYASLTHLLALRPQFVKLDRKLVTGVDADPHRAAAVAAIGAFAGELDAWLIAEGIETQAELDRLIELDVPMVQGYYLGRPDRQMNGIPPSLSTQLRERQALRHREAWRRSRARLPPSRRRLTSSPRSPWWSTTAGVRST